MSQFKSGFARLDVTPPLGVLMAGSFSERKAEGILDNLYATAVAVNDGLNTVVVISIDMLGIHKQKLDVFRKSIAEKNSISVEAVFIECTHTHS
ncbi:MAG: hypothetical protein GX815_00200, partial [Clostridiales bacterium]|nr:hypothetical protein [Clostridiales bacterium]